MRIFGRERQSLNIDKVMASRAIYDDFAGARSVVEVRLRTEGGERLDLQVPTDAIPRLITELTIAYEAIRPPIPRGMGSQAAGWNGMD